MPKKVLRIYLVTGKQGGKAVYFKVVGDKHPFICKEWCTIKLIGEYTLNEKIAISQDFSAYFSKHILPYLTGKQCPECGGPATHPSGLCRSCYQGKLESEEI